MRANTIDEQAVLVNYDGEVECNSLSNPDDRPGWIRQMKKGVFHFGSLHYRIKGQPWYDEGTLLYSEDDKCVVKVVGYDDDGCVACVLKNDEGNYELSAYQLDGYYGVDPYPIPAGAGLDWQPESTKYRDVHPADSGSLVEFSEDGKDWTTRVFICTMPSGKYLSRTRSDAGIFREWDYARIVTTPPKLQLRDGGKYLNKAGRVSTVEPLNGTSSRKWIDQNGNLFFDDGSNLSHDYRELVAEVDENNGFRCS